MAEKTRILLLGATGYIGGSILTELIEKDVHERYALSALVRKPYQASILADAGVSPLLFKDFDDFDTICEAAKDHDIVVAAASARHEGCAKACITGLGERQKIKGHPVHYIHVSGASMIGDWPITGKRIDTKVHSDINENIYELEQKLTDNDSPVRNLNQFVVKTGLDQSVRTYIIPPPLIFGAGTGFFTLGVGQVHMLAQLALKKKQAVMIGSGSGIWNRVHVNDLSNLFALLVAAIVDQKVDLPYGKDGYYFAEDGFQTWKSISERIANTGKAMNYFETQEVGDVTLQEAADEFYDGSLRDAEAVLASNARIQGDKARQILNWNPTFRDTFEQEVDEVLIGMYTEPDD